MCLQLAGGHGSAPASIMSTASSSQLLDAREGCGKRQLSAAQSDSNLLAPRRLDVVPSSADRNALDFYEHDVEHDESSPRYALAAAPLVSDSELDNNRSHEASNADVPPLDFSLTRKFDELKRIMKSNRSKRDSGRHEGEPAGPEVPAHSASMAATTEQTASKSSSSKTRASKKSLPPSKTAAGAGSSGSSGGKRGSSGVSSLSSAKGTAGKHLSADDSSTMSHESLKPKRAVAVPSRKVPIAGTLAPPVRSRKEMKIRNGVSLSDLKAEHRAALEMLKELGGPVDVDYQREEIDAVTSTSMLSAYRSGKANSGGISRSTGRTAAQKSASSGLSSQNSDNPADLPPSPSTSTISGASLVTKLRASISSGRDRSHDSSAETCSPIAMPDSPMLSIGCKNGSDAIHATDNNDGGLPSPPVLSQLASEITQGVINSSVLQGQLADVAEAEEEDEETQVEGKEWGLGTQVQIEAAGNGEPETTPSDAAVPSLSSETSRASLEDSWRRYADKFHNDGDEEDVRSTGNNDQQERECDTDGTPPATRSGDRYSDEDFEDEW
ncbi:hypothetical protein BBJ28_00001677 [Nothophytophthora sp. Chile5]|nr:hypothetical protein BBJ28_00001677 [Nothophytophthora sp. Chile5]